MADGYYTPQDIGGFGRLANMEIQKRQEDRLDKEAATRNELANLQLSQVKANLAKAERRDQVMAGLPERLKSIPEGENQFSVAHNYFMEQGETDLAMEYQAKQSEKIEQLRKIDPYAATDLYNKTLGKVSGVEARNVIGQKDLIRVKDKKTGKETFMKITGDGFEVVPMPKDYELIADSKGNVASSQKTQSFFYTDKTGKTKLGIGVFNPTTKKFEVSGADIDGTLLTKEGETPQEKTGRKIYESGESERAKRAAEGSEKISFNVMDTGFTAADSIPTIKSSIDLLQRLKTGGVYKVANDAKRLFGVQGADAAELSYNLSKAVLSQLRDTFGAQFTEKEGERLETIEAGFGKSTEGNIRLLNQLLKISEEKANKAIRRARARGDLETVRDIQDSMGFDIRSNKATDEKEKPKKKETQKTKQGQAEKEKTTKQKSDPLGIR